MGRVRPGHLAPAGPLKAEALARQPSRRAKPPPRGAAARRRRHPVTLPPLFPAARAAARRCRGSRRRLGFLGKTVVFFRNPRSIFFSFGSGFSGLLK